MRWRDETENYFFRKSLNFRENDTEALEISKRLKLTQDDQTDINFIAPLRIH